MVSPFLLSTRQLFPKFTISVHALQCFAILLNLSLCNLRIFIISILWLYYPWSHFFLLRNPLITIKWKSNFFHIAVSSCIVSVGQLRLMASRITACNSIERPWTHFRYRKQQLSHVPRILPTTRQPKKRGQNMLLGLRNHSSKITCNRTRSLRVMKFEMQSRNPDKQNQTDTQFILSHNLINICIREYWQK